MEKELQSKLVEIMTAIQDSVSKAADFAWTQLSDIAYTYVIYGRVYETLFMLTATVGTAFFAYRTFGPLKGDIKDPDVMVPTVFVRFTCLALALLGLNICIDHLQPFTLVWFAPKVWLLKELAGLIA